MKNAFYFLLKALFVLEIFTFLFWLLVYVQKRLAEKAVVYFQITGVKDWIKINYNTHIVQYSRSKATQTMTFGHLPKYNRRNIFPEKSYTKCGEKASSRPFYKKIKTELIFGLTVWNTIKFVFFAYPSCGIPKYVNTVDSL